MSHAANKRSSFFYVAEAIRACWKCKAATRVIGIVMPSGHESLEVEVDDDDNDVDTWVTMEDPSFIHYVSYLPPEVEAKVTSFSKHYRVNHSKTAEASYWMNHCEICGMKQGDFQLYSEPQGAFFPLEPHEAARITLHRVQMPIEAFCGSYSYDIPYYSDMPVGQP